MRNEKKIFEKFLLPENDSHVNNPDTLAAHSSVNQLAISKYEDTRTLISWLRRLNFPKKTVTP